MRRQWILIGQSFLKTIRTIGDKKRNRMRVCMKSRPVLAGTVINGLSLNGIQLTLFRNEDTYNDC